MTKPKPITPYDPNVYHPTALPEAASARLVSGKAIHCRSTPGFIVETDVACRIHWRFFGGEVVASSTCRVATQTLGPMIKTYRGPRPRRVPPASPTFELLGGGVSHSPSPPIRMQFEDWSNHLLQFLRLMPKLSVAAALAVSQQLATSRPLGIPSTSRNQSFRRSHRACTVRRCCIRCEVGAGRRTHGRQLKHPRTAP
jgi:hypothetical protein